MDIDVTNLKSRELIKILEIYPYGVLTIKYERVFWCSDYAEPEVKHNPSGAIQQVAPPNQRGNLNKAPQRMLDVLGSMMGSPGR